MQKFLFGQIKLLLIIVLLFAGAASADENATIMATGDALVVKKADIDLLRSRMKTFFSTTEQEYCKAMLKIKLFSMEAKEQKLDLESEIAAEIQQMIEQKLSGIYINKLTKDYQLLPGTIKSYYLSHTEQFKDKEGNTLILNDVLREKIRGRLMETKKSEIANKEMERLMEKYHVNIVNPICSEKE